MNDEMNWVTGKVRLSVGGRPLDLEMTVPGDPVPIRRMLPVFQQMSNSFVSAGIEVTEEAGRKISCKMGCGACCRQPVPVSETEAFELADLVENLPEPKRSEIRNRFSEACGQLEKSGWFKKLDATSGMEPQKQIEVVDEYFSEGIPCPFLEDESCSIHARRPVACREYLVTSPAENCSAPSAESIDMVELPFKPSATLCSITKSRNKNKAINFVPLVLSLVFAEKYSEDKTEKTGEQWMADFFMHLTKSEIPNGPDKKGNC